MRRMLKLVILAGLIWSGYWYVAGYGIRSGLAGWFEQQRAQGWQADYSDIATSGYPARHMTMLSDPALADPATGTAWRAEWLLLDSPAIWPGRQVLHFPATAQRLSYLDQTVMIAAQDMLAELHLAPGINLDLRTLALRSGEISASAGGTALFDADSATLSMQQAESAPTTYDLDLSVNTLTPGENLRQLSGSDSRLPRSFDALEMRATVTFDKPWDRSALEQARPQPRIIDLELAEMNWGALRLFATGEMTVDDQGIPTGEIAIKAENWREMLNMAQTAGVIPEQAVDPAARVLGMLAGLGGNPKSLDVQLNLRDGFVALGPIPLGPAPRLILR